MGRCWEKQCLLSAVAALFPACLSQISCACAGLRYVFCSSTWEPSNTCMLVKHRQPQLKKKHLYFTGPLQYAIYTRNIIYILTSFKLLVSDATRGRYKRGLSRYPGSSSTMASHPASHVSRFLQHLMRHRSG